ncbi:MAG: 2-amino-4-hydroxy-6-hydroxymethyldihydropteridine diphosphokinase [Pseudomonadota bacterium]
MRSVALALGANLGDRAATLARATAALARLGSVEAVATPIETDPLGPTDQPIYLNGAVLLRTGFGPQSLLAETQAVERTLGRRRTGPRWGPRRIDIDLILFGDIVMDRPALTLPHPDYRQRDFVLRPLSEIAPHWRDPRDGARIVDLWARFNATPQPPPLRAAE